MKKKLSVAFLWHMHQPVYQDTYEGIFFMPWVRLHAVKDYLDMLYKIDKFPNLKLNFNLSPTILVAFEKYGCCFDAWTEYFDYDKWLSDSKGLS